MKLKAQVLSEQLSSRDALHGAGHASWDALGKQENKTPFLCRFLNQLDTSRGLNCLTIRARRESLSTIMKSKSQASQCRCEYVYSHFKIAMVIKKLVN